MRTMKDSGVEWIGKIPQGWNVQRGKYTFSVLSGFAFPSSEFSTSEGIPLVRIRDITSGVTETFFKGEYSEEFLVDDGDLLIGMDGDFGIRVWDNGQALLNQRCCKIIANKDNSLKYLFYVLPYELKRINDLAFFTTVKHLSTEDLALVNIPLPSGEEQQRIADYLDAKCAEIDALIAAKEKTNTLLKERRQSIIYEAVTKGLVPNAPMKVSGIEWIGEIPVHWEVERLKHHIEFNPKTEIPEYGEDDSVSFIPMDCLRRGVHTSQTVDYSKVKSGYVDFAEGDILMAKVTPCLENGNLAIAGNLIDGVGFGSTEINVIRCKSIHREYLFYILQCKTYVDRAVADMYGVAGLKRLNPSFIPNTKYPMPSIEEQQKIAEYLAATCGEIDELVVANERTIEKLKEYRQSVIYEAVTGKLEV